MSRGDQVRWAITIGGWCAFVPLLCWTVYVISNGDVGATVAAALSGVAVAITLAYICLIMIEP